MKNPVGRPKDLEKHHDILQSARTLFLELGYDGSTMEHIAKHAGVSKLTVYKHFHDKESLFTHVIQQVCDEYVSAYTWELNQETDFKKQLMQFNQELLHLVYLPESLKLEYLLLRLASEKSPLLNPFYTASHSRINQLWQQFFQQSIDLKLIPALDIEQNILIIGSLLLGLRHHHVLLGQRPIPTAEQQHDIAQQTTELFCKINGI